ncbi:MaoC family dehydratase [Nocardia jinanensis]|uniref:Molybdenum cofactor biosynthesis protein MoeC n=1 Tax=Nocardia jinanensis TaxID=382504 RepID=A0A917RVK8_9NOCA|nr:MaoC family dehydratase [Nocardia jinanensis]GGL40143.1 molybdenum cofactor biosynthesis protein MoeC [Nocardia jinanensis]
MTTHHGWHGRYYEDFVVGDVYEHPLGRTVTDTDNTWFTLLTQNTAPIHFDHEYAAATEFGKPLVVATLTLALVAGQSVGDVSQNVFANVGWNNIVLPKPVFAGDTIRSRSTVLAARESASRPQLGLITVSTEGYNQRAETVISYERSVLVYKRGHGPRHAPLKGISA